MHAVRLLTVVAAVLAIHAVSASPVYSRYRGVSIGDSVHAAVTTLNMTASDIAVVHARPSLIQQISWRPNHYFSARTSKPDAIAEMVLPFHLGRISKVEQEALTEMSHRSSPLPMGPSTEFK